MPLDPRHDDEGDFWTTGHWNTALCFALHTCIWADIAMFECGRTIHGLLAPLSVGQQEVLSKLPTFAMTVGMAMALYV